MEPVEWRRKEGLLGKMLSRGQPKHLQKTLTASLITTTGDIGLAKPMPDCQAAQRSPRVADAACVRSGKCKLPLEKSSATMRL